MQIEQQATAELANEADKMYPEVESPATANRVDTANDSAHNESNAGVDAKRLIHVMPVHVVESNPHYKS